jgi:hypothetical protein
MGPECSAQKQDPGRGPCFSVAVPRFQVLGFACPAEPSWLQRTEACHQLTPGQSLDPLAGGNPAFTLSPWFCDLQTPAEPAKPSTDQHSEPQRKGFPGQGTPSQITEGPRGIHRPGEALGR